MSLGISIMSDQFDISQGAQLEFEYKGEELRGIFIHEDKGVLTIKLESGYNISAKKKDVKIKSVKQAKIQEAGVPIWEERETGTGKTRIAMLATGGTIASRVDYTTGAVKPAEDISFVTRNTPDLGDKFRIRFEVIERILSENITPDHWILFARRIKEKLSKDQGVIVSHGTDTMSYTSSAVSFMLESQTGPVVFVGSQRSPDRPSSDAFTNIEAAVRFASTDIGETGLAMHSSLSDDRFSLHRAVRSRKMHTTRRDAFKSVGSFEIASYEKGSVKFHSEYRKVSEENVLLDKLDQAVGLIYFHPSLSEGDFEKYSEDKKAVVIMGTGMGHVADRIIHSTSKMIKDGKKVLMTSQCLNGEVNLNVYSTGRELLNAGVVPLENMLPEVAYIKAMFVLANYPEDEFEKVMLTNLRGEILERTRAVDKMTSVGGR